MRKERGPRLSDLLGPALLAAAARPARAAPPPGREEAIRAVTDVFSDPELAAGIDSTHEPALGILAYLSRFILGLLEDVLASLSEFQLEYPALYWTFLILLLALLALLLAHIAWTFSLAFRGLPGRTEEEEVRADRVRRFREIRDEARRLAAEDRHREGVRELLLALVALVEERKVISVARGWTIREIISRVALRASGAKGLGVLEKSFEEAWYGGAPTGPAEFARCDGSLEDFARSLTAPAREANAGAGGPAI